jgi:hypothetical protein
VAIPVRGFGLSLGIGQESAWGTPVAITNWLRLVSSTLDRKITRERLGHQGSYGQVSTHHRYKFDKEELSGGRIEWHPCYNDSTAMILRHVFGTTPTDAGANPYTHTYTLASPPPAGLTLEQIDGTHATLDPARVFEGCKVDSFELTIEAGRPVLAAMEVIGQTATGYQAPSATPTYTTSPFQMLPNHLDTTLGVTFNSNVLTSRRLVLSVRRNLQRNMENGSLFTSEPFENRLEVELELEVLWSSATPRLGHYAGTTSDLTFTLSNSPRSAAFTLHNCTIDDVSSPVQAADGIRQTVKFVPDADATDQGLGLVLTNANALYTAN